MNRFNLKIKTDLKPSDVTPYYPNYLNVFIHELKNGSKWFKCVATNKRCRVHSTVWSHFETCISCEDYLKQFDDYNPDMLWTALNWEIDNDTNDEAEPVKKKKSPQGSGLTPMFSELGFFKKKTL